MSDSNSQQKVTYIGKIDYRNKQLTFGIKERDRTKHTYVIGKSGMGKSTLLENLIIQDINNGEGVCVIDPHGSMAEKLLDHIPESRIKDVVYFAPFDGDYPMGLNMLEKVSADKRYLLANGMMSAFKKIFTDGDGKGTFSARMEYVLNNIILALLENEGQTLLGVNRMLFDKEYRKFIVSNVTDPTVKDFWVNEYANYTDKTAQELAPAIQNKIGQFVSNPLIRNIIGQKKTSFDVRKIMDEKKILIVNLSKGKVGEGNANLLGSLLITKIYLAAMSRADVDPYTQEKLPPCYFYVDEFQNFANESFASILSEARKYKLALTVAHQYIEQMTDDVKAAVFGNVGTMITFRVGATDAEVFEKEFAPYFILDDFVNLSAYQIYIRLMIDDQGSKPFSARTLDPIQKPTQSHMQAVISYSRNTYAKQKFLVEEEVAEFYKPVPKVEKTRTESSLPDGKYLKVNEYKGDTQYPPRRNDNSKRFDNNLTRYDDIKKNNEIKNPDQIHVDKISTKTIYENKQPVTDSPKQVERYVQQHEVNKSDDLNVTKHSTTQNSSRDNNNNRADYKKPYTQPPQEIKFDEKPAMSLKDALAKALSENTSTVEEKSIGNKEEERHNTSRESSVDHNLKKKEDEEKKKKEIAEDVLRKLIEE
ncbi:type IV secretion system DNA-binding domain-containing protein [Candidatus Gracilibacteria bacterium]|nr:type IV secretion system DNA-binding domain-containing protein [Candidatus Gracilibacteria bacterium]MCF7898927.1 type IV secretion system DNA-binding domain-containing protein [Candidatus Paceibacterota bacterium]